MKKLFSILIINLTFINFLQAKSNYEVVGYLPSWVNWELKDIDAKKLTTVQFSFLEIANGEVILGKNSSKYTFEENLIKLQYLKKENPKLKLTISVGGWGIDGFSDSASTEERRYMFSRSIINFLEDYNFDGVDLDWEFPMHGGWGAIKSSPEDKDNFVLLVEELRNQLNELEQKNNKPYTLSVAVGVGPWVTRGIDFKAMELNVDHFGIMSYNLSGAWSQQTESHVNLYKGGSSWSTDEAVKKILETGVNPNLLVLGVAFYGRPQGAVQGDTKDGLYQKFQGNGGKNSATYKYIKENMPK